jgi:hypothetical protein
VDSWTSFTPDPPSVERGKRAGIRWKGGYRKGGSEQKLYTWPTLYTLSTSLSQLIHTVLYQPKVGTGQCVTVSLVRSVLYVVPP